MRLLTFEQHGSARLGVLTEAGVVDVASRDPDPAFQSMQALIEAGPAALERLRDLTADPGVVLAAESMRWLAPLPRPAQMRDFVAFESHMAKAGAQGARLRAKLAGRPAPTDPMPVPPIWYQQPLYYKGNRFAVGAPEATVRWPSFSSIIDYELELACVIGVPGRDIVEDDAPRHIFGYTIFNDLTARDAQFQEMQGPFGPCKGKDFDGANVLGPVIVTADAIDASNLVMRARVDGEIWSEGSSSTQHWSFAQMIAHVSRSETLHSGEVFGSGTVGGGCGLELGRFLKHGDRVELEIEGIGRLATRIDAPHVLDRPTL